jgi:hypothetical protein
MGHDGVACSNVAKLGICVQLFLIGSSVWYNAVEGRTTFHRLKWMVFVVGWHRQLKD